MLRESKYSGLSGWTVSNRTIAPWGFPAVEALAIQWRPLRTKHALELARELLIEAAWIVVLLLANRAAFARGVRRYGAYGG